MKRDTKRKNSGFVNLAMDALRTTDEKIEYLREEVKKLSSSVKNVHEEYNKISQFLKELRKLREMEELRDINHSAEILFEFMDTLRHIGVSLFRKGVVYSRDCFIVIMLVVIGMYIVCSFSVVFLLINRDGCIYNIRAYNQVYGAFNFYDI